MTKRIQWWTISCLLPVIYFTCGPAPVVNDAAASEGLSGAEQIIDRAIAAHGMQGMDSLTAEFTFRDRVYGIDREGGRYRYTRSFRDSLNDEIFDELTNDGLRRSRNGVAEGLSEKDALAYAESVNSVRYFFMLPFGLRDPAVNMQQLPDVVIDDKAYHRVEVTFDQAGGGTDHDDVYNYFFDQVTGEMDYLAYTFKVNDGGIRFRKAINKRRVGGVLVQDYINYGVDGQGEDMATVVERYSNGELPELSRIINTGIALKVGGQ